VLVVFARAGGLGALFAEDAELLWLGWLVFFVSLVVLVVSSRRTLVEDGAPLVWAALVGI
jgi:hypothetical protein